MGKRERRRWLRGLLGPAAAVLVVLCFLSAVSNLERGRDQESKRQLEDALRRSCVACYAAEGVYPPDLAYLEDITACRSMRSDSPCRMWCLDQI